MRSQPRSLAAALLPAVMLAACSGDRMHGSPFPPDEFGPRATAWFGCPKMQGMYAWPPEAGEYANGIASNRTPWEGGKPVPIGRGKMQVWVIEDSLRLTMLSRDRPADGNTDPGLRRAWGYSEHDSLTCRNDMLDADDEEIDPGNDRGCAGLRRSFRLARLEDGALAVGIRTVAHGCRQSILAWGDQSAGDMPLPDQVIWRWSKLRRIGDGAVPATASGT